MKEFKENLLQVFSDIVSFFCHFIKLLFFKEKKIKFKDKRDKNLKYDFMPDILEIIEKPASRHGKTIIWSSTTFVITIFIWALLSEMDVVVTAQGNIMPAEGVVNIQMPFTGMVKEVKVSNGEQVEEGQVLACIESDYADIDVGAIQSVINRLEKENRIYRLILDDEDIASINVEDIATEDVVSENIETKDFLTEKTQGIDFPENNDSVNKALLLDLEYLLEQEKLYQKSFSRIENEQSKDDMWQQHRLEIMDKMISNNKQIQELCTSLEKLSKNVEKQDLKASNSGVISGIVTNLAGMTVDGGSTIMQIVPTDTVMEVEAYVSNSDIGSINVGDRVAIKVNAYPYSDYGIVDGELTYISDAAISNNNNFVYLVKAKILSENISERKMKLITGMVASVEIKTGKRTVMDYFLEPLRKNVDSAMKEK